MASIGKICGDYKVRDHPSLLDIALILNRDDLTMLLAKAGSSLSVKTLLENLQITTEFESSMSKKWATAVKQNIWNIELYPLTSFFSVPSNLRCYSRNSHTATEVNIIRL